MRAKAEACTTPLAMIRLVNACVTQSASHACGPGNLVAAPVQRLASFFRENSQTPASDCRAPLTRSDPEFCGGRREALIQCPQGNMCQARGRQQMHVDPPQAVSKESMGIDEFEYFTVLDRW
jgi:hypothetical protein